MQLCSLQLQQCKAPLSRPRRRPAKRPELQGETRHTSGASAPELPAPTTGSLLPFRFLNKSSLTSALPSPLAFVKPCRVSPSPPRTPLARHSHPEINPRTPPQRSPIQARGRHWRRASPGGRGGQAQDAGRQSLAQGERSGVSPGPCPAAPIHKSAAAASGPAASARDAPLGWRRPRDEPPSALVAGMRNRGGGGRGVGSGEGGRPPREGRKRAGGRRGAEAARHNWRARRGCEAGWSAPLPQGPRDVSPGIRSHPPTPLWVAALRIPWVSDGVWSG